jgi:hypothetical protein
MKELLKDIEDIKMFISKNKLDEAKYLLINLTNKLEKYKKQNGNTRS